MGDRRVLRRGVQLVVGLLLFGASMAAVVRSQLGNIPWDVLHQGVAEVTGLTFGTVSVLVSVVVLLLWVPLRTRPGIGTVLNALLVGPAADLTLAVLPADLPLPVRVVLFVGGVLLNAVATAMYIGARTGPGARDGLFTGLVERTGWSVRLVRTAIEVVVVAVGWALGGTFGVGTVVFVLVIGPLIQPLLPRFRIRLTSDDGPGTPGTDRPAPA